MASRAEIAAAQHGVALDHSLGPLDRDSTEAMVRGIAHPARHRVTGRRQDLPIESWQPILHSARTC